MVSSDVAAFGVLIILPRFHRRSVRHAAIDQLVSSVFGLASPREEAGHLSVPGTASGGQFDGLKGASVGLTCVAACEFPTDLTPDSTCACPTDAFEVWHIEGLYLEGDGIFTLCNSSNEIVADILVLGGGMAVRRAR